MAKTKRPEDADALRELVREGYTRVLEQREEDAGRAEETARRIGYSEEELAAVTVPPSRRNAGRICGIFSSSQRNGFSSRSTVTSFLRVRTRTGTISLANAPLPAASRARVTEAIEKASWSSRVNL